MGKTLAALVLAVMLAGAAAAPARAASAEAPLARTEQVLWTTCTLTLYRGGSAAALDAVFERLREIQGRMSTDVAGSALEAIAASAGRAPVPVTEDVLEVTRRALEIARLSGGLFDPTVGPLIAVWKINTADPQIPAAADIAAARSLVDWREVVVDEAARTVFLRRAGMRLDLGGLVKGYAADEAVRILTAAGVSSAIVDLGGDIYAMGSAPAGQPWRIGVQAPEAGRGSFLGVLSVSGMSVVTSGVYEHFFIKDGRRYHHLMDTRTGWPVDNGLASVTVAARSSMDADGLALALFAMGPREGMALAERLGLHAVMVDGDRRVFITPHTRGIFTLTDTTYRLADPLP
jgi:FAD:protein FMN transferase